MRVDFEGMCISCNGNLNPRKDSKLVCHPVPSLSLCPLSVSRFLAALESSISWQSTATLRHCWNLWRSRLHQKICFSEKWSSSRVSTVPALLQLFHPVVEWSATVLQSVTSCALGIPYGIVVARDGAREKIAAARGRAHTISIPVDRSVCLSICRTDYLPISMYHRHLITGR